MCKQQSETVRFRFVCIMWVPLWSCAGMRADRPGLACPQSRCGGLEVIFEETRRGELEIHNFRISEIPSPFGRGRGSDWLEVFFEETREARETRGR